jgi:hypothetical protein
MFIVSAQITRSDVFGPNGSVWRSVRCGPFLAAEDQDPDDHPAEYFCELDVAFEHPEVEANDYEVEVTYQALTPSPKSVVRPTGGAPARTNKRPKTEAVKGERGR